MMGYVVCVPKLWFSVIREGLKCLHTIYHSYFYANSGINKLFQIILRIYHKCKKSPLSSITLLKYTYSYHLLPLLLELLSKISKIIFKAVML